MSAKEIDAEEMDTDTSDTDASDTDTSDADREVFIDIPDSPEVILSADQQSSVLQLLLRGASPSGACQQIGLPGIAFARTLRADETFRIHVEEATVTQSYNVAAALYRAAMEGSVSAQVHWLKNCPPPGWQDDSRAAAQTFTFDHFFGELSDDELTQLARAMGVDLPPEAERDSQQPPR